jgi:hypothetical protein
VTRLVAAGRADGPLPAGLAVGVRRHGMANARISERVGSRTLTWPSSCARIAATSSGAFARSIRFDLGDLTGSTIVVAVSEALLSAGYSRDAERAADAYAVPEERISERVGSRTLTWPSSCARIAATSSGAFARSS